MFVSRTKKKDQELPGLYVSVPDAPARAAAHTATAENVLA